MKTERKNRNLGTKFMMTVTGNTFTENTRKERRNRMKKLSFLCVMSIAVLSFFVFKQRVRAEDYSSWSEKNLLQAGETLSAGNTLTMPLGSSDRVNFYVTDFGINQWKPEYRTGDTFANLPPQQHYSGVPQSGQVLVVMPPDQELYKINLTDEIFNTLKARVDGGLAVGTKTFEIRLVDHINLAGYLLDPARQKMVNDFDCRAYSAIGRLNNYLESKNLIPSYQIIPASDAAIGFCGNIAAWEPYARNIEKVSLIDSRASETSVINMINVLTPEKVRMFNTKGDAAGLIGQSTSVYDVSKDIKRQFPGVELYLLDNISRLNVWWEAHESSIRNPTDKFLVTGQGYSTPKQLTGQGIKEQILGISPLQHSMPTTLPQLNIVNLNTLKTPEIWQAGMGYIGPQTLERAIPNIVQSPVLPQTFTTPINKFTDFNDLTRVNKLTDFNDWDRNLHMRDIQALQKIYTPPPQPYYITQPNINIMPQQIYAPSLQPYIYTEPYIYTQPIYTSPNYDGGIGGGGGAGGRW